MLSTFSRNTLIASTLLVGASILTGTAAFAQNSGIVSGEIEVESVATYSQPSQATLDPDLGNTNMDFGSVNVRNNSASGWRLNVTSTNSGNLLHDSLAGQLIPYTNLDFTGDATLGNSMDVFATVTTDAQVYRFTALTCATTAGCDADITADITNTAIDGMPSGIYKDTLTFTLVAP